MEARALAALDAAPDAIVCLDAKGRVIDWNATAQRLLGWERDTAMRRDAAELLGGGVSRDLLRDDIARTLAGAPIQRVERRVAGPAGLLDAELTITALAVDDGPAVTVFLRDVTAARRTERRLEVEHNLARTLAAARSGQEVARDMMEMVARGLDFDHAELWLSDDGGVTQRLAAAWRRTPDSPFAETARELVVPGAGVPRRAWEIGETICFDDVAAFDGLLRRDQAREEGIRGCAVLPIRAGGPVVGMVLLARVGGEPLDPELRQTLNSIAAQVSLFAERRAKERHLARDSFAVAAVARATRRLTAAVDAPTARQAIVEAALEVSGAGQAVLALPDPDGRGLAVREASPPLRPEADVFFPFTSESGMVRAFTSGEPVFFGDLDSAHGIDHRARDAGVMSGLLQPIVHEGSSLGVLGVAWQTRQRALDTNCAELIRLLADEAAMAISRVELVSRLESAARTDPLTGLANVRAWDEQLTRELATAGRDGRPVAVAVLDLDGFKELNDERGHQHGDRVLRTVAAEWQAQLRQGDTLARLGGDEFAVLLPGCRPDDAVHLAERLREVTESITVSIGVAYWDGEEPPSALRGRADAALYAAKAAGRDRVWAG